MNPRIRELQIQADEYADEIFDRKGKMYGEIVMERFAELIVRECAEVAANVVAEHEGVDFGLVEKCYKHFGVEE